MTVYILNIIITIVIGSVIAKREQTDRKLVQTNSTKNIVNICVFLLIIMWTLIYALRFHVGSDSWSFYNTFQRDLVHRQQTFSQFVSNKRDFVFSALEYFCYKIFNGSWIAFSIVLGLITYISYVIVIRKESYDFTASILLFIFCLNFYSGFNVTRQAISVGLTFLAFYRYFRKKKYFKYAVLMFLAFGIHSAAIFVIPIHFLCRGKFDRIQTVIRLAVLLVFLISLKSFWPYVIRFLSFIGQDKMVYDYSELSSTTLNVLRLIVYISPAVLGIVLYPQLPKKNFDVDADLLMVCYGAVLAVAGLTNVILTRLSSYMSVCEIILIPKLIKGFSPRYQKLIRFIILLLYFIYMVAIILNGEGHYYPYQTVFKFGVR